MSRTTGINAQRREQLMTPEIVGFHALDPPGDYCLRPLCLPVAELPASIRAQLRPITRAEAWQQGLLCHLCTQRLASGPALTQKNGEP
jgi:hypothetical protein